MACKNQCEKYKVKVDRKNLPEGGSIYDFVNRCMECSIHVDKKYKFCPCCNQKLRSIIRDKQYRAKKKDSASRQLVRASL